MLKFMNRTVYSIFAAFITVVLLLKVMATCLNFFDGIMSVAVCASILLVLLLTLLFGGKLIRYLENKLKNVSVLKLILTVAAVSLITKVGAALIFGIDSHIHPDIQNYITFADQLVRQGHISEQALYAYQFYYSVIFAMFLYPAVALFGASPLPISIFFSITQTLVALFVFDIVRQYKGRATAFMVAMIWVLLPSEILTPQYAVHELGLLFFNMAAMWVFFTRIPKAKSIASKTAMFLAVCLLLVIASSINRMGYISIIAIALYLIAKAFTEAACKKRVINLISAILIIAAFAIGGGVMMQKLAHSVTDYNDDMPKLDASLKLYFYVGINSEMGGYYSKQDVDAYRKYDNNREWSEAELDEYKNGLVQDRVNDLISKPQELASLLFHKTSAIWGESSYALGYTNETIADSEIASFYNRFLYKPLYAITNMALLIIVFIGVLSLGKRLITELSPMYYFAMFMMGVACVLLITEVTNKYAVHLPLYLVILCFFNIELFTERSERFNARIKKLIKCKEKNNGTEV